MKPSYAFGNARIKRRLLFHVSYTRYITITIIASAAAAATIPTAAVLLINT